MYVTYSIFFVVLWREMMRRRRSDGAAVGVVVHWSPPSIHSSIHSKLTRNPNWNHNVSGNLHIHSTHCGIFRHQNSVHPIKPCEQLTRAPATSQDPNLLTTHQAPARHSCCGCHSSYKSASFVACNAWFSRVSDEAIVSFCAQSRWRWCRRLEAVLVQLRRDS